MTSADPNFRAKSQLERKVVFEFYAPLSEKVELAGDFNSWKPAGAPLKKDPHGKWKIELRLKPGRYEYRFKVDGTWQNDQNPCEMSPNPFGTWNCVIKVQ